MVVVAGLDPSGSSRRPSGLAILYDEHVVFLSTLYSDRDIVDTVKRYKPVVVAIDSPLSHSIRGYREVDLVMKRMGYRVLPPSWRSMRMLIDRSIKLMNAFLSIGIGVIETHPLSALRSSGCRDWIELTRKLLPNFKPSPRLPRDAVDALIAALVAKAYVEGTALSISARDGVIYLLPRVCID